MLLLLISSVVLIAAGGVQSRTGIVHLFEWKFDDIAKECVDFLGPYGYDAVQVSPVNENAIIPNRPWYERYQPFSYKIMTRSGNEEQFKNMIKTCNKAGIKIYVDVVFNHMSATLDNNAKGTAGSVPVTKDKYYPDVPFSMEHFHPTCNIGNYQDLKEVRNCELLGLHDLNQTLPHVKDKIVEFLNHLVDLGVAGFRVDAAKHMWPEDLGPIYQSLKNLNTNFGFKAETKPFIYQEVIDKGGEATHSRDYTWLGHVTEFRYGAELSNAFKGNNLLKWLVNFGEHWNMLPSDKALVFVDNHDNQRDGDVLTYKSSKLYKMAVGFMLSWPYGTQRVMSSFYFDDRNQGPPHNDDNSIKDVTTNQDLTCNNGWVCEHRWRQIYSMVGFANAVKGTNVEKFMDNGSNQISYCRGNKGFVAINGDRYDMISRRQACLPAGRYCDVISGLKKDNNCTGKVITVNQDGTVDINLGMNEYDGILAIHKESQIDSARGRA